MCTRYSTVWVGPRVGGAKAVSLCMIGSSIISTEFFCLFFSLLFVCFICLIVVFCCCFRLYQIT